MSKKQYDLLMSECDAIAAKLKLFPTHVQTEAFRAMYTTLMDTAILRKDAVDEASRDMHDLLAKGATSGTGEARKSDTEDWNHVDELMALAEAHDLRDLDGVGFSAAVVYFYTVLAPSQHRVSSITVAQFEEACLTVGHPVGNPEAALNNAKRKNRRYLQGGKRDGYSLTGHGKNYVKNTVLMRSESQVSKSQMRSSQE